ncbi:MAG TPA: tetratricopeptide repeat protein [Symbiobacteriaceae bacterium]|nr:tetratricopeptide repeat protein [Symbiobacteriaceae bacterium]
MENEELAQWIKAADAQYAKGRTDGAFEAYTAVLQQDPAVAWAHSRIGAILAQRGRLDEAEQSLNKALELDPELPQAHSNLGNIYYTRGEYDRAVERYQIAAKLDPANPVYHENLHAAFKKQKKYTEAVKALKQSHKLVRDKANVETRSQFQGMKRRFGCASVLLVSALLIAALAFFLTFA